MYGKPVLKLRNSEFWRENTELLEKSIAKSLASLAARADSSKNSISNNQFHKCFRKYYSADIQFVLLYSDNSQQ